MTTRLSRLPHGRSATPRTRPVGRIPAVGRQRRHSCRGAEQSLRGSVAPWWREAMVVPRLSARTHHGEPRPVAAIVHSVASGLAEPWEPGLGLCRGSLPLSVHRNHRGPRPAETRATTAPLRQLGLGQVLVPTSARAARWAMIADAVTVPKGPVSSRSVAAQVAAPCGPAMRSRAARVMRVPAGGRASAIV